MGGQYGKAVQKADQKSKKSPAIEAVIEHEESNEIDAVVEHKEVGQVQTTVQSKESIQEEAWRKSICGCTGMLHISR